MKKPERNGRRSFDTALEYPIVESDHRRDADCNGGNAAAVAGWLGIVLPVFVIWVASVGSTVASRVPEEDCSR